MKNTNKGFTLIELLAVIVILGIIALITIPVVTGVIEKAKVGSAEASVLGYVDAIENEIIIGTLDGKEFLKDGFYDYDEIPVSIKGQAPDSGWFKIEEGQLSDYSFVIGGYVVTKGSTTEKGDTAACKPIYKAYTLGELVYFDPASDDECNETTFTGENTCYKWRVIEIADTKCKSIITIQMDHNLINVVAWAPEYNTTGPVTALTELNIKTKAWSRVEPLDYKYDTSAAESNYGEMKCTDGNCTLNGKAVTGTSRARMITVEEVRDITNTEVTDSSALSKTWTLASSYNNWFYFSITDYKLGTQEEGQGNTNLAWLVENTMVYDNSGATSNEKVNYGYWTLSPVSTNNNYAWSVSRNGRLSYNYDYYDDYGGVRPVITVLKSNI